MLDATIFRNSWLGDIFPCGTTFKFDELPRKLPLTMKSCFYPLIGNGIFGWIGDFIDVFSIIATLFGVCTSLGLGARQVATGLAVLSDRFDADSISLQVRQFSIYLAYISTKSHTRCSQITF